MTDKRNERNFTELEVGGWYENWLGGIDKVIARIAYDGRFELERGGARMPNGDVSDDGKCHILDIIKRVNVVDYDDPDVLDLISEYVEPTPTVTVVQPPTTVTDTFRRDLIVRLYVAMIGADANITNYIVASAHAIEAADTLIKAMEASND